MQQGGRPAAEALAQVWDATPQDVQNLLEGAAWTPKPSPPPGLNPGGKGGKGKGNGKEVNKEKQEATKLFWQMATEDQQKLLEAAGVKPPVEAKPALKELCKKFEDSLPPQLQEALKALDPKPNPARELQEANMEYKKATMDLRKLINKKAELQHDINTAKETYQKLLQTMQELTMEEKEQQEKVQTLQKTLHERVAGAEDEPTCEELDLQAMHLTKEQQEALSKVLGQKPVKVAFQLGSTGMDLNACLRTRKPGETKKDGDRPRSRSS